MTNSLSEPILEVSDLLVSFRIGEKIFNVVENLSFKLYKGKCLSLLGESGCGKTMTALAIMRILPTIALSPQGRVNYQGKNILSFSEYQMRQIRGSRIAMIFQDPSNALNPVYRVGNQLLEVVQLHLNMYGEEAFEYVLEGLKEVGISNPADIYERYPHELSGGLKQRVMIAMALLCKPDILIADEPTTALDVTIQAQVLKLIKHLLVKKGMALLLITHDMGVVSEMADNVVVMYASQAVESGNVSQIFEHTAHPYTMGLFQSRPTLDTPRGALKPIKGNVPALTHYPQGCRFHPRCPYQMSKCLHGEVPNFIVEVGHHSKCWLHDNTEESEQKWKTVNK